VAAGVHLAEAVALLLLPMPAAMITYALLTFQWRKHSFNSFSASRAARVDDRLGPLLLVAAFVLCMLGVVVANVIDLEILLRAAARGAR
jgi:uncharacterized membrane protein YfcA